MNSSERPTTKTIVSPERPGHKLQINRHHNRQIDRRRERGEKVEKIRTNLGHSLLTTRRNRHRIVPRTIPLGPDAEAMPTSNAALVVNATVIVPPLPTQATGPTQIAPMPNRRDVAHCDAISICRRSCAKDVRMTADRQAGPARVSANIAAPSPALIFAIGPNGCATWKR